MIYTYIASALPYLIRAYESALTLLTLELEVFLLAHTVVVLGLQRGDALLHLVQPLFGLLQDPLRLLQLFRSAT